MLFFVLKRGNDITERVCLDPHDCLSWSVLKILELPFFHIKIIWYSHYFKNHLLKVPVYLCVWKVSKFFLLDRYTDLLIVENGISIFVNAWNQHEYNTSTMWHMLFKLDFWKIFFFLILIVIFHWPWYINVGGHLKHVFMLLTS